MSEYFSEKLLPPFDRYLVPKEWITDPSLMVFTNGIIFTIMIFYVPKTENSFRITGTASDAQSIDGVYYILKDNSSTPGAPDDTWTKAALQGSNWQASLDLSSGNEGVYYLFISAVDSAHNIKEPQMYKIYGDKNSPELVINQGLPFYSDGGEDSFLSGTVEDTYLESFTVTGGNSGSVPEISGNTWKLGLGDWPDGNYTLVFTARDKAGRETVKNASVVVDSGAPVVEFTSITPLVDANNRKDNVNGTIYFGEITFYPQSGLDPNLLPETDLHFGQLIKLPSKHTQK